MKRLLIALIALVLSAPCAALAVPRFDPPERTLPVVQRGPLVPGPTTFSAPIPYGGEVLSGARFVGLARLGTVHVDVLMQMRDEAGLLRYAQLVSDPHSLYYRNFLTPQQIGDFFGAPRSEYTRAIQYFWSQGLSVRYWTQREGLAVIGTQAQMERTFHTRFGVYTKNGVTFYAPMSAPRLATPLAIRGLGGIETYHLALMRRHFVYGIAPHPMGEFGPGFLLGNSPFDLAAAFDYTGAYNINGSCCRGDGVTIGIVGTGPIFTNANGTQGDAVMYRSLFNVSGTGTVKQKNGTIAAPWMSTGVQPPPPVTGPCGGSLPGCNPEDSEAQLDTEQTNSLAPNAQVLFYLTYNPNECFSGGTCPPGAGTPQIGLAESDDELEQIANDNVADVVSGSYGSGEKDFAGNSGGLLNANGTGFEPSLFATLAAQGISVFFSTGDSGAEECQPDGGGNAELLCVAYPADDPNVVAVGGTTTPIASNGQLSGIITVWGKQTQSGATGGGFSSVYARPAFQPAGSFCADNGMCDSTHRLQPDLALNADPNTGVSILLNSGPGMGGTQVGSIGGTSAAAPGMAAMWALVVEACKQTVGCAHGPSGHAYRFGNPRPLLYGLSAANRQAAFFDVVFGNNAVFQSGSNTVFDPGFNAGPGFDLSSGFGAPFARNLIKAVVGL